MKVAVIIPCRNEGLFIRDIVIACKKYVDKVVVSDDGSTDNTVEEAKAAGADVVVGTLSVGTRSERGMGATVMRVLQSILTEYQVIVTLDGDGQHNPDDIPALLQPILDDRADLVTGSRFCSMADRSVVPLYRRIGIGLITLAYNIGHTPLTDSQCCIRAYRSVLFEKIAIIEKGFAFSTEVLVKTRHAGFRIVEVPVNCVYHERYSHNSTLNPVRHGVSVLVRTIRWRIWETLR